MFSCKLKSAVQCHWKTLAFALTTAILSGCAAQGGPGGGPSDRIGPQLISTEPQNGATQIDLQPQIKLLFSEPIDNRLNANVLQITPPMTSAPKLKIRRKLVTIILNEPLQSDRTYIFNFGRNLKDYQNNPSSREIKLAFATGDSLDDAVISGHINDIPPQSKTEVWLFTKETTFPDTLWKATPNYIVAVDDKGNYQATNLPAGEFRAMAVSGQGPRPKFLTENDLMASPQVESLIINSRHDRLDKVDFRLTKQYLKPFRLLTLNPTDGYLELNFSRPLQFDPLHPDFFVLSDTGIHIRQAWINEEQPTQVFLLTDSLTTKTEYQLNVCGLRADNNDTLSSSGRSLNFTWQVRSDTLKPKITKTIPASGAQDIKLTTPIQISLSEPIYNDTLDQNIRVFYRDSVAVPVHSNWLDANTLIINPDTVLLPANSYSVKINCKYWQDHAGNKFRDSLVVFKFSTIDQNLFGSITGKIMSDSGTPPERLFITAFLAGSKFQCQTRPDSTGYYEFRELLPGKYTFTIWKDRNSDGKYNYGRITPYIPAEPYRIYPNQVNVRSRWETAEVNWEF